MKTFFEDWAVTFCGAFTSILTAMLVALVHNMLGINIFTFTLWVVVPVGAGLTGFAAASGYLLGSLYFHHKPTRTMLLNMIVIAAGTQFLIYYMEYSTLVLDDGRKASDIVGFGAYLDVVLTKAKYGLARMPHNGVEVGSFGYVIAVIQFLGFALGGLFVYLHLKSKHMCEKCKKYFRKLAAREMSFVNYELFKPFAAALYAVPPFSKDYVDLFLTNATVSKSEAGTVKMTFSLHGCPSCKQQYLAEEVSVYNGKDWKDVADLTRKTLVPEEQNLLPEFTKKAA